MKNKRLIKISIAFFLIINTSYFWAPKLGIVGFIVFSFLFLVFFVLVITVLVQLFQAYMEKYSKPDRLLTIGVMVTVLFLIFLRPGGLIDFDNFRGKDLLVAQREGGGNCRTVLKLKEDNRFIERSYCFGISETKGSYLVKSDSIFFSDVELGQDEEKYYEFGLIKSPQNETEPELFVGFKNHSDSTGYILLVSVNELIFK